ncbi:MAG TPA: hypothetical protein VKH46_07560 [Thermoanaerobaculia bacterium]|jgi:hypothetical protein|nr:hypothetical protein [Thermoanaerobaculia bacterium]
MRIGGIRTGPGTFGTRFAATVVWEDSHRPPVEIWWDLDEDLAADAFPDPNAFVAAAFVPALRHGERRIAVEGAVCPLLAAGLEAVGGVIRSWHPATGPVPRIEPRDAWRAATPRAEPASAGYLTGGIDSLHLFYSNREDFPAGHPARFSHALWIRGLDYPGAEESPWAVSQYARLEIPLREIAADVGVRLAPITTNLRRLDDDLAFFAHRFLGAALLSGAHLLAGRFSTVALGSSWPGEHLVPWGSHPLLDPSYGSAALAIRHEALGLRRVEKVARLRERTAALARLICCGNAPAGASINCGRCTKCVRTLVEMEASGVLEHARSFPSVRVTAETIRGLEFDNGTEYFWGTLVDPIRARGRGDLASAIERKIRATIHHRQRVEGVDWTGAIRRFDRDVLGGRIKKLYRRLFA